MNPSSLAILHLSFGLILLFVELVHLRYARRLDFRSMARLVFALFYGLGSASIHLCNALGLQSFWASYINYSTQQHGLIFLLCLLAWIQFEIGWWIASKFLPSFPSTPSIFWPNTYSLNTTQQHEDARELIFSGLTILIIGCIVYLIYAHGYGGLGALVFLSDAIRSGMPPIGNPLSFLQRLGGLVIFGTFLLYASIPLVRSRLRFLVVIAFVCGFLASVYVLLTWAGRLALATLILSFPIAQLLQKFSWKSAIRLSLPLFAAMGILILGDQAFHFAQTPSKALASSRTALTYPAPAPYIAREFGFPQVSIVTCLDAQAEGLVEKQWFRDALTFWIHLFPDRVLNDAPDSISQFNTQIIDSTLIGGIPTDLVSYGLYNLGIPGVWIVGLLFGLMAYLAHWLMLRLVRVPIRAIFYVVVGMTVARSVAYADPVHFAMSSFYLALGAFIFATLTTLRRLLLSPLPSASPSSVLGPRLTGPSTAQIVTYAPPTRGSK
jgi:hypothetical protein